MEPITLSVYSSDGKTADTIKLDSAVFNGTVNKAAVYQAVNAYLANNRKGLAATKTRGEVSGGGKKPWKQKGTGRSRHGSTRSPIWRHGGVTFGPHPRDFSYTLPAKIKDLALRSALCEKINQNNFLVLDNLKIEKPSTKEAAKIISSLKLSVNRKKHLSMLLLVDKMDENIKRAFRNIGNLSLNLAANTHVFEILSNKKILITKDALSALTKRLQK